MMRTMTRTCAIAAFARGFAVPIVAAGIKSGWARSR